jgi:hypothetical protein
MAVEINKFSDIIGVVATQNIPEGRMVLLTTHSFNYNFGSKTDLMGVKLPADSTEGGKARYVAVFAQDNRSLPIYQPMPFYTFNLRKGWGRGSDNVPITGSTIYLTHPGNMKGQTIPSGSVMSAHGGGVYTVPSGAFIYSSEVQTPGTYLVSANTADDGGTETGKLKYSASATSIVVERYNSTTKELTFRTLVP